METTDSKKLVIGRHYFDEDGNEVELVDYFKGITAESGRYLVRYHYEGTTIKAELYPQGHTEISADYKHEGEPTIIKSIFKVPPTKKLEIDYKKLTDQIIALNISIGVTKDLEVKYNSNLRDIKALHKKAAEEYTEVRDVMLKDKKQELADVQSEVDNARQKLSELQDSIGCDPEKTDVDDELVKLRKRDYRLMCLEAGGVDNWDWYSESLKEYWERYPKG